MDEGFSPEWRNLLRELSDIGKEKLHACRLPCGIGRVVCMKTTLRTAVSTGSPTRLSPTPASAAAGPKPPKIEDRLRDAIRERHYSLRTEVAYTMCYRQVDGALPRHPTG